MTSDELEGRFTRAISGLLPVDLAKREDGMFKDGKTHLQYMLWLDGFRLGVGARRESMTAQAAEKDPMAPPPGAPGAKLDAGKAPVLRGLLAHFPRACQEVAEVSAHGASKHTWNGWESVPDGIARYGDALARHLCKGALEQTDSDSHLPHAAHAAWNALAVLELTLREVT